MNVNHHSLTHQPTVLLARSLACSLTHASTCTRVFNKLLECVLESISSKNGPINHRSIQLHYGVTYLSTLAYA